MTSDLIGRRQIMQQRLDRVRDLEFAMRQQVEIVAARAGVSVEQLDFDGSLRAALAALSTLAARRTTFDVVLSLPNIPAGVRIQQTHSGVSVEVVPLDAPAPSVPAPAPTSALVQQAAPPRAVVQPVPLSGTVLEPPDDDPVASDLAALLWQGLDGA